MSLGKIIYSRNNTRHTMHITGVQAKKIYEKYLNKPYGVVLEFTYPTIESFLKGIKEGKVFHKGQQLILK